MNIRLKQDSRDLHYYQFFGQVTDFPLEVNYDRPVEDKVQPIGNTECTAYTVCDIAQDETGVEYDIDDLFNRIPHTQFGADPRQALGEAVKNGLLPKGGTERVKKWGSYWTAHTGNFDAFDNFRSALLKAKAPGAIWTNYYSEWNVGPNGIMPVGVHKTSAHMYDGQGWKTMGWKQVGAEPMLVIQAWQGYVIYMPRETFNAAVKEWGCGSAVLSIFDVDIIRKKSLLELLIDAYKNLVLLLQAKQAFLKSAPMNPTDQDYIYNLAYSYIGKHLTLDDTVPMAFGCAQAVSYVLIHAGYDIPPKGISSTILLYAWLFHHFDKVTSPETGDIIISVTNGSNHGHCGVVGKNAIMSNDSQTGDWQPYWSLPAWLEFYQKQKGLVTKFYRAK